jgi:hypothetical protein
MPATTIDIVQQSMEAGDANVVETIDRVAHDLRGDRSFLGHR